MGSTGERVGTAMTLLRLALIAPEIPQNTGTILRMAACFDVAVDIVGPVGFSMTDARMRRALMDYADGVKLTRHADWSAFLDARGGERLILATTRADHSHVQQAFRPGDCLLFGNEGSGAPQAVHDRADERLRIPMQPGRRSLNLAVAAAVVTGEALRQIGAFA